MREGRREMREGGRGGGQVVKSTHSLLLSLDDSNGSNDSPWLVNDEVTRVVEHQPQLLPQGILEERHVPVKLRPFHSPQHHRY